MIPLKCPLDRHEGSCSHSKWTPRSGYYASFSTLDVLSEILYRLSSLKPDLDLHILSGIYLLFLQGRAYAMSPISFTTLVQCAKAVATQWHWAI